jgi:hypothetical protein
VLPVRLHLEQAIAAGGLPASLALLRFTGGLTAIVAITCESVMAWTSVPLLLAMRRLSRADI